MNGISNRLSRDEEAQINAEARENWDKRIKATGIFPGTHSLGKEFETAKKKEEAK
jgi:hypothetical protein